MTNLTEQVARAIRDAAEYGTIGQAEAAIKAMEQHSEPNWEGAPEWATCRTVSKGAGIIYWEVKPKNISGNYYHSTSDGKSRYVFDGSQSTLEPRPEGE